MSKTTLVLVDGSSYLYAAFHAMPPLTNAAGSHGRHAGRAPNMMVKLTQDFAQAPAGHRLRRAGAHLPR